MRDDFNRLGTAGSHRPRRPLQASTSFLSPEFGRCPSSRCWSSTRARNDPSGRMRDDHHLISRAKFLPEAKSILISRPGGTPTPSGTSCHSLVGMNFPMDAGTAACGSVATRPPAAAPSCAPALLFGATVNALFLSGGASTRASTSALGELGRRAT